ncbi:hypothetical protein F0562_006487 [Nyssa sinensis]|uniref:Uncharacterized protein n=1 Tax=Nyssa sinensis TaxID=561372 RepID=A0A5J5APT6_9ASTE|nr:hypothetical protein F0562_006487 [Nyssa sinensis]
MAPFSTELQTQAPIPLHPPFMKCNKSTPTWHNKLQPSSTIWQFATKGKQAHGSPIAVQNLYPVVEELKKWELPTSEDGEIRAECVEESGEVEDIGPEEDPTGRAGTQGEAKEPLEWGLGAPPEPAGLADFYGGGEEDTGEDRGGNECHGQAMESRDRTERDGATVAAEDEAEEEVE